MIVDRNTNPERDLYYLGGKVIEIIADSEIEYDYMELFADLNKSLNVSISLYSLVLDWLYILGVIRKGKKGRIVKCF